MSALPEECRVGTGTGERGHETAGSEFLAEKEPDVGQRPSGRE